MTHVVRSPKFGWITAVGTALTSALLIAAVLTLSVPVHQKDGIDRGPFSSPLQDTVQPAWLASTVIDKAHDLGLGMPGSATYSKTYWSRAFGSAALPAPPLQHGTDLVYVVYLYYPQRDPNPTTEPLAPTAMPAPAFPDQAIQTIATIGINADTREVFASFVEPGEVTFERMGSGEEQQELMLP